MNREPFLKDIETLDDITILKILRDINVPELCVVCLEIQPEVRERFWSNMSEKAAEMIKEEIYYTFPPSEEEKDRCLEIFLDLMNRHRL